MTQTSDHREEFLEVYKENTPKALGTGALQFQPKHTNSFLAEMAVSGSDLIFHFHKPTAILLDQAFANRYWGDTFPTTLDRVARTYFRAEHPQLEARRIQDADKKTEFDGEEIPLDSWWFRARGFALNTSDPEALAEGFYLALERDLRNLNRT